jgi:hypothetical protein
MLDFYLNNRNPYKVIYENSNRINLAQRIRQYW